MALSNLALPETGDLEQVRSDTEGNDANNVHELEPVIQNASPPVYIQDIQQEKETCIGCWKCIQILTLIIGILALIIAILPLLLWLTHDGDNNTNSDIVSGTETNNEIIDGTEQSSSSSAPKPIVYRPGEATYNYSAPITHVESFGDDQFMEHYVGGKDIGWYYLYLRDIRCQYDGAGGTLAATDIQYPFHDIHVKYGDTLIFTQYTDSEQSWDDLVMVTQQMYEQCDFTDSNYDLWLNGAINTASSLYLAAPYTLNGTHSNGTKIEYRITIKDYTNEPDAASNDYYGQLIRENTLYFTSSQVLYTLLSQCKGYEFDANLGYPAFLPTLTHFDGGLKVKVMIEGYRSNLETKQSLLDIANSEEIQEIETAIGHLGRLLILQQFSDEQRIRSEGNSGLTNVRGHYDGDSAYDDGTYTNGGVASIHDHSDNILIVGIGEIQAVLNGVEFATRHNDYNLNMASTTSSVYGAVEAIPYPSVPPSVLNAGSINNETLEMQEYFRAFKYQNKSHRDYSLYFKAILCYLEGTWILDDNVLNEPFDSDRHSLDAATWKELHDKIRWMANSGRKNSLENLAHLPSSIRNLYNSTYPIISNWEYRILCHPLKNDIPTSRFKINNDLSVQLMGSPKTRDELYYDRRSRFDLNRYIDITDIDNTDHQWSLGRKRWNYMDFLMEQIPGKDNYIANITDSLPDGTEETIHYISDKRINAGYYSRFYGLSGADAMGTTKHRRGWADRYLFAAATTQKKVSPIEMEYGVANNGNNEIYKTISRWSYAIPFEIIYLTPLTKWNPYNITFIGRDNFDYNRIGLCSMGISSVFNGWTTDRAYFTPSSFFDGITSSSMGDTASDNVCNIASNGEIVSVYPSGHWITFPSIANNVGLVRQRYPIFPIHEEHNTPYKEVKALQDIILSDDYDNPLTNPSGFFGNNRDLIYGFIINLQGGGHQHIVYIPGWQVSTFWYDSINQIYKNTKNNIVYVEADERNSHSHTLTIWRDIDQNDNKTWIYHIKQCGYGSWADQYTLQNNTCSDGHDTLNR